MSMVQMAPVEAGSEAQRAVEDSLILFAVWLVEVRGVAPRTAQAYVSTVRAWHARRFGEMLPAFECVRLRAVLKGMQAVKASRSTRKRRRAVRTQMLAAGMAAALDDTPDGRCARAALSLAFCGLLRVGEYTTPSAVRYDAHRLPTVGDVTFSNDEFGEVATVMIWPRKKGVKVCGKQVAVVVRDGELLRPVTALREMLCQRRAAAGEPLFLCQGRPLTKKKVTALVQFVVRAVGGSAAGISSHSLRIGGATAALAAGVPPETIRIMGRWDSEVYAIYCRMSRQAALRLGVAAASTPFDDFEGAFVDDELS